MTDLYKSILLPLNRMSCQIHCCVQQFNMCGLAAEQTSTPVATTIYRPRDNTNHFGSRYNNRRPASMLVATTIYRDNTKPTWVVATTIDGQLLQRKHTDCGRYSCRET